MYDFFLFINNNICNSFKILKVKMAETNRKLATILATDCVNFSKHMESNEEKTLRNLNECRKIIDQKISDHGGKKPGKESAIYFGCSS